MWGGSHRRAHTYVWYSMFGVDFLLRPEFSSDGVLLIVAAVAAVAAAAVAAAAASVGVAVAAAAAAAARWRRCPPIHKVSEN